MMSRPVSSVAATAVSPVRWLVVLCAQWCGTCRGYRAVMEAAAARFPDWRAVWVDIEDQAELLDDLEVETFPTVLLYEQSGPAGQAQGAGEQLLFFGPMLPQEGRLLRQLELLAAQPAQHAPRSLPRELQALADWLRRGGAD
jgi:thioredoxin 1